MSIEQKHYMKSSRMTRQTWMETLEHWCRQQHRLINGCFSLFMLTWMLSDQSVHCVVAALEEIAARRLSVSLSLFPYFNY